MSRDAELDEWVRRHEEMQRMRRVMAEAKPRAMCNGQCQQGRSCTCVPDVATPDLTTTSPTVRFIDRVFMVVALIALLGLFTCGSWLPELFERITR